MRLFAIISFVVLWVSVYGQDKTYSFIFLNKKPDAEKLPKEQLDKIMEGHLANIGRLAKEGKLLAAGPFEGGGGIFILNTTSVDEAKSWLSTDPGIQANRWNIEILSYTPRVGSVCSVSEPYEMVTYEFIRFTTIIAGSSNTDILTKHDDYLKQLVSVGNVITEGVFGDHNGGILVMTGEIKHDALEADPAIQAGLIGFQFKQLWIAKGAFCEK